MAYNNNAYDFDRFAPRTTVAPSREKKAVIKKLPQSKNKSVLNVNTNVIFNAVVAVAVVVLICINIYTRIEIHDTQKAIAKADKQIETLLSEETRLNVEMEKIVSYSTLEEEATALGMQKRSKSQIHYIDTSENDYAEIVE